MHALKIPARISDSAIIRSGTIRSAIIRSSTIRSAIIRSTIIRKASSVEASERHWFNTKYFTEKEAFLKSHFNAVLKDSAAPPEGWEKALPFKRIPGPKPLPLVGNLVRFAKWQMDGLTLNEIHTKLRDAYGPFCLVQKLVKNEDWLFIFTAKDAEEVSYLTSLR